MNKKILIISIVTLLALAIVAGFLWFAQNGGESEVMQKVGKVEIVPPVNTVPPTISPTPTPQKEEVVQNEADVDTSDWKIYTNEKYGFSLRYPEGDNVKVEQVYIGYDAGGETQKDIYGNAVSAIQFNYINNRSLDIRMIPKDSNFATLSDFAKSFDGHEYYQLKPSNHIKTILLDDGVKVFVSKIVDNNGDIMGLYSVIFKHESKYVYMIKSLAYSTMPKKDQKVYFAMIKTFKLFDKK